MDYCEKHGYHDNMHPCKECTGTRIKELEAEVESYEKIETILYVRAEALEKENDKLRTIISTVINKLKAALEQKK